MAEESLTEAQRAEVAREVDAARAALSQVGITGGSLRVVVGADGRAALPMLETAEGAPGGAWHTLAAALEAQQRRQAEGAAVCAAVADLPGGGEAEAAARRRAQLCARLHRREAAVLEAAKRELQRYA